MILNKFLTIPLFLFLFSSCIGGGSGGFFNSQVSVRVVSQFNDSFLRTATGRPYIRLQGGPRICRVRAFNVENIRERLLETGVSEEILNDYLFYDSGEESSGESAENSSKEERSLDPIPYNVGENWIEFGLQIQNNTDFALIINSVRLNGIGRCGGKTYSYSGDEKSPGYCSGSGFPILYIVPPRRRIEYRPDSTNPFHNLKLYFSGFEIEDRRGEPSKRLQNIANTGSSQIRTQGDTGNSATQNESLAGACEPNREDYAIPRYQLEVSLRGYFIGLSSEYATVDFFKRVSFSTEVIY